MKEKKNYGHSEFTKVCDHTQLMCDCGHNSNSSNVAAPCEQRIYFDKVFTFAQYSTLMMMKMAF